MIEATEITDVTPITMPNIVSAERPLCERRVCTATMRFSLNSCRVIAPSVRTQRDHGIEFGGSGSRINAKKQADERTQHQSEHCYPSLHRCGKRCQRA